jgi:FkbM family methyltransferase
LKQACIKIGRRILPSGIKNSLFHFSYHLAPDEFEAFSHAYAFAPNMRLGLKAMAKLGFSPCSIIDVGAYQGGWSEMVRSIWPSSAIIMVEPNAAREPNVRMVAQRISARLIENLLGAEDGREVDFNVMASGSSVMSERSPLVRTIEKRKLGTLDSVVGPLEAPIFLKIDAQGYELEILKGAKLLLKDVSAVLLEVSIIEINEGAPLLHDVILFMKNANFLAYDILEIHRRPLDRALNQIDIIFVREGSQLHADNRHFSE